MRLRIATGGTAGEYFRLGRALAQRLADAIQAARTVDARSAILTQPVPLHDGALRWFSDDAMA